MNQKIEKYLNIKILSAKSLKYHSSKTQSIKAEIFYKKLTILDR